MPIHEVSQFVDRLVERYNLRPYRVGRQYVGIHRAVGMHVLDFDGLCQFNFFAAGASLGVDTNEHFQGFRACAQGGILAEWFLGPVSDDHGCAVEIDDERLEQLGIERCLEIPDLVSRDFQAHGAPDPMPCSDCGAPSTEVVSLDKTFSCLCVACHEKLREAAPQGELDVRGPVQWRKVWPRLVMAWLVGGTLWGILQDIEVVTETSLFIFLLLLPVAYGFGVCYFVLRTGTGVNLRLRAAIAVTILAAVLVGNLWGYHTMLEQQAPGIGWALSSEAYFRIQLQHNPQGELPYFFGGVLGALMGFRHLRDVGRVKVR